MTRDQYIEQFKRLIIEKALARVTAKLFSRLPFLAWGPIGPVVSFFLSKLIEFIINHTELEIFIKYSDIRTTRQGRDLYSAMTNHMEAKINGTEKEKKDTEKALKVSFNNFIKLTN